MTSKIVTYGVCVGLLAGALSMSRLVPSLCAQQPATSARDALQKARVLDRLAEAIPTEHKGVSPSFVLDPAWPQPLPHHWVIGDIGGIAVDKHDRIWVYHRPRSVSSSDSGMQGVAGTDSKGNPISALGFARPFGQLNDCCMPAPSVLVFDKAGKLLQSWGGPGDPGFLEMKCRQQDGCVWPAREHGIYIDQSDFVYVAGNGSTQVPLSSVARIEKTLSPLVINHQGSFPAVTITPHPHQPLSVRCGIDRCREGRHER